MKILIINTSEQTGGAAIAASRLMEALRSSGITAEMAVLHKSSDKPYVTTVGGKLQQKIAFLWERVVIWTSNLFSRKNLFKVSIANTGVSVTSLPEFQQADLIHLHWINQGMISLSELRRILTSGKPVVWTMHDMWECTAICHHAYECRRFQTQCKQCPYLRFPSENDLSAQVFRKKLEIFSSRPIHFVAVSSWLKQQAAKSRLLNGHDISVIPNTLSTHDFQPMERSQCRTAFQLPADKKIILFGAARIDDPIKGFPLLLKSISHLLRTDSQTGSQLHLVLFGEIKQKEWLAEIPIPYSYLGSIRDTRRLCQLYSAADVMVSASYYETFGQTLIEAQACGCIPVSFGNSGQQDIIRHKTNGYLAEYLSEEDLAQGISWALHEGSQIDKETLCDSVKQKYEISVVASTYQELYQTLISKEV